MKNTTFLFLATLISCIPKTSLDEIVEGTDLVYVGEYTLGLEGPAVDKFGNLYFVNPHHNGSIGKVSALNNEFEVFIDSLPNGSVGNGIRFGSEGQMYVADYANHNILSIDPLTKTVATFAHEEGMNQPNDIAISEDGMLYASDPDWDNQNGNIWRIDTSGPIHLMETDMGTTNGIEVAPGDSILYVNESVQRKVWSYKLDHSGNISNKKLLIEFADFGLDGMRCDVKGNLYIARYEKGTIAIVSPFGDLINEISLKGRKPTNLAFGGKDGKTCFVTCQDRGYIEQFRAEYSGRSWKINH